MSPPCLMDRILAPGGLRTVFQPIYRLRGESRQLHAVECLARGPNGSNAQSAAVLFEYVRLKRYEPVVDRACIETALSTAAGLGGQVRLTLNVHARTLASDKGFVEMLATTAARHGIQLRRITAEIVEQGPALDRGSFRQALAELRKLGLRIALDDVGIGESNFHMMLECRPEYLKIDRSFVDGASRDRGRAAVLEAVALLSRRLGSQVVAEGVEQGEDLELARSYGIRLFQGFLFCPPLPADELLQREPSLQRLDAA